MTSGATGTTGILGGSFDPPHDAHLAVARTALAKLDLARILWIPAGRPPHRTPPVASAGHRAAMVRLTIEGEPRFVLDEREVRKISPGYTIETLESLRTELGRQADLVLIIGADQFGKLETWHRWKELFAFARIAVFARPDYSMKNAESITVVPMAPLDISSTAIRARIAAGESVRGLVPGTVLDYIEANGLYSSQERTSR